MKRSNTLKTPSGAEEASGSPIRLRGVLPSRPTFKIPCPLSSWSAGGDIEGWRYSPLAILPQQPLDRHQNVSKYQKKKTVRDLLPSSRRAKLVTPGGVEPPLQDRKSWVLGRWTMESWRYSLEEDAQRGTPGPTRTDGLQIRSLVLYPTELRARVSNIPFCEAFVKRISGLRSISSEVLSKRLHGDLDHPRQRYGQHHAQNTHHLTSDQHHNHND